MVNAAHLTEKTAKLLLVEDDPIQVRIIHMMLARHHVEITTARDYDDAIALAHHIKPDVILVDIRLSTTTGIEAIRTIKSDPELQHIPVIAMTAVSYSQTLHQAYAAGCDLFLSKPVRPNDLLEGIHGLRIAS